MFFYATQPASMIQVKEAHLCACDSCGKPLRYWQQFTSFREPLSIDTMLGDDEDWLQDDVKHYCNSCWSIDKNEDIILKPTKKTEA